MIYRIETMRCISFPLLNHPIDSRLRGNDGSAGSVILASRQYLQGGESQQAKPTKSPSPLMGEESKARVN